MFFDENQSILDHWCPLSQFCFFLFFNCLFLLIACFFFPFFGAGHSTHSRHAITGFALQHAISRIDVAGRDVTEYLQLLLRKGGHNFHTSAEMEVVKSIKESEVYANLETVANVVVLAPSLSVIHLWFIV